MRLTRIRPGEAVPFLALALAAATALGAGSARAQTPGGATPPAAGAQPRGAAQSPPGVEISTGGTEAANDPARVAFTEGLEALGEERYAEALVAFERSYRVRRVASVALNLGITLRALGRYVEARQRFREFFEMATEAQHARHDHDVQQYMGEINQRIGRVHLDERTPPNAVITVDGTTVTPDTAGDLDVDPGDRRIEAEAPGFDPFRATLHIERGGRPRLRIALVRHAADGGDPRVGDGHGSVGRPPGGRDTSVTSQWWFWTIIGVGVAAAVVIPVAVASSNGGLEPAASGLPMPYLQAITRSQP